MIDRQLFYLIGVPGAGKTTLFQRVLADLPVTEHLEPFAWLSYPGGIQLGKSRGLFSGTDALPMNVQPRVIHWLDTCPYRAVVAEGDRLGNGQFFDAVRGQGWHLTIASLEVDPAIAATRREQRNTYQNPAWVRGRGTKVANLSRYYVDPEWRLNARMDGLVERVQQHPAFKMLRDEAQA